MPGRSSGGGSSSRAAEVETCSARCGLNSEVAGGKSLSGDQAAFERATGSAVFVAAPSSVGMHADANTKCAADDCLGEWFTMGSLSVESNRPTHGNPLVQYLWGEAGMHAVRRDPELKRFYHRKLIQKGLGKARVAVARKLGIRESSVEKWPYERGARRGFWYAKSSTLPTLLR